MPFVKGPPPGPHAGAISPDTVKIRPKTGMTLESEKHVRKLRRTGITCEDIASKLGFSLRQVEIVCANLRMPNCAPKRVTGNLTLASGQFLKREARPGEPQWATHERIIEELLELRERVGKPR